MCAIIKRLRDEQGVGVVAALLVILILALLGTVMVALTVQEMDAGLRHMQSEQALMIAEGGLQYAQNRFAANSAWTGLAEPGRALGRGHFIVVVNTTDADGTTLTGGVKALHVIGIVGTARREVVNRATPSAGGGATVTTLYARAQGNALSFSSPQGFTSVANMVDGNGVNLSYGQGEWQHQQQVVVGNWTGASVSGTVSKVELLLYGFVSGSLSNDYATVDFYLNNADAGSTTTLTTATLNTRVSILSILLGPWNVDVTAARSWAAADFAGDLELLLSNVKNAADDGRILYIDAAALKVTTSAAATTFDTYREVIS